MPAAACAGADVSRLKSQGCVPGKASMGTSECSKDMAGQCNYATGQRCKTEIINYKTGDVGYFFQNDTSCQIALADRACIDNSCAGRCVGREFQGKTYSFCDRTNFFEEDSYLINPGQQCPKGVGHCYCRRERISEGAVCQEGPSTSVPLRAVCQRVCGAGVACRQNGQEISCLRGANGEFGDWKRYELRPGDKCPGGVSRENCICIDGRLQDDGTCVSDSFLSIVPRCSNGLALGEADCSKNASNVVQFCTNPSARETAPSAQYTYAQCQLGKVCGQGGICVPSGPSSGGENLSYLNISASPVVDEVSRALCGPGYRWVYQTGGVHAEASGVTGQTGYCKAINGLVDDNYPGETTWEKGVSYCSQTCRDVNGCKCFACKKDFAPFGETCGGYSPSGIEQWFTRTGAILQILSNDKVSPGDKLGAIVWQVGDLLSLGGLSSSNDALQRKAKCEADIASGTRDPGYSCAGETIDVAVNIAFTSQQIADAIFGIWKGLASTLSGTGNVAVERVISVDALGLADEFADAADGLVIEAGGKRWVLTTDANGKRVLRPWTEGDNLEGIRLGIGPSGEPCTLPLLSSVGALSLTGSGTDVLGVSNRSLALKPCPGGGGNVVYDEAETPITLPQRPLGFGAYGVVYLDENSGSVVKIFRQQALESDVAVESANNEILFYQTYGGQANIAEFRGYVYDARGNVIGYRQELIEGETLEEFYNRGGRLTQAQIDQAVSDLREIHEVTGRAHGDLGYSGEILNPSNIIVQRDGTIRFIDFSGLNPDLLVYLRQNELNAVEQGLRKYAL